MLHNQDFKPLEFEEFKNEAGANAFTMSPQKWINATNPHTSRTNSSTKVICLC